MSLRTLLIADPDPETARLLGPVLRARGCQVVATRDGSRALELTILRFPDLVLFDEQAPLLDAETFIRILQSNPRTEQIPVLVLRHTPLDFDAQQASQFPSLSAVDSIARPFNIDEIVSRMDEMIKRTEASRAVVSDRGEVEGSLSQIPLVDLLQILSVNRKTGRLSLSDNSGQTSRGEILLLEGSPVDAHAGARVAGEKALFRLLGLREGQFSFLPGPVQGARIEKQMAELLLDGLRIGDELAQLSPALPLPDETLELTVPANEVPLGTNPAAGEVVRLLNAPTRFGDLVDLAGKDDLEASRVIGTLLDQGFIRKSERVAQPIRHAPLLEPYQIHALRSHILRGQSKRSLTVGKVLLVGGGPLARRSAAAQLDLLPDFVPTGYPTFGYGTLGRVSLDEGLAIDLCELEGEHWLRPLWRPFCSDAIGAVALLPADDIEELLSLLAGELRLPIVVCGPAEDALPDIRGAEDSAIAFGGSEARLALRTLLTGVSIPRH